VSAHVGRRGWSLTGKRSDDYPADGPTFLLPSPLPVPPRLEPAPAPAPATPPPVPAPSKKRPASGTADDDDDGIELLDGAPDGAPPAKRARTDASAPAPTAPAAPESPSKRRRLEEDGLVLLDAPGETVEDDDDVILVD
jgi:ubiquitin-like 1-activating enzyme E1 B